MGKGFQNLAALSRPCVNFPLSVVRRHDLQKFSEMRVPQCKWLGKGAESGFVDSDQHHVPGHRLREGASQPSHFPIGKCMVERAQHIGKLQRERRHGGNEKTQDGPAVPNHFHLWGEHAHRQRAGILIGRRNMGQFTAAN